MSILPKGTHKLIIIPLIFQQDFFIETDMLILKFIWKFQVSLKDKAGKFTLSDIKTHHKVTKIKTV